MEDKKSYYAIIPANVRYDKELTPNAKLLYGEITALCNEKGFCWASNSYFANLYEVSNKSISKWVKQLAKQGYVATELIYRKGTKEVEQRRIYLTYGSNVPYPGEEMFHTPGEEMFQDNNTSFNNTTNIERNDEGEDSSPTSEKFDQSTIEYQLSQRLYDKMVQNDSKAKHPNLSKWAEHIDKLIRLDERSIEDIERVIDYCQDDDFWKSNILSTNKLRMKFPQLYLKVKDRPVSKTITKSTDKGPKYKGREYAEETKAPPQRANYEGRGY